MESRRWERRSWFSCAVTSRVAKTPPKAPPTESMPRVLVVDDDPPLRRMLERTLAAEGYEVSVAAEGGASLAEAERAAPDVIVLDVAMPGLDGLAVARRLRDKGDPTPILMLTARDAVPDRVSGLEAGAGAARCRCGGERCGALLRRPHARRGGAPRHARRAPDRAHRPGGRPTRVAPARARPRDHARARPRRDLGGRRPGQRGRSLRDPTAAKAGPAAAHQDRPRERLHAAGLRAEVPTRPRRGARPRAASRAQRPPRPRPAQAHARARRSRSRSGPRLARSQAGR